MNLERALSTMGWMSESELTYLAELASRSQSVVEIGSWRGRSARVIADNTPGKFWCVDTWADNAYGAVFPGDAPDLCQQPNWLWNEFNRNLADKIGVNVEPLRMTSADGSRFFANKPLSFDMIFIDAGHNYDDVVNDIFAWGPLLREGGVLCGHDYNPVHHPEVIRAVHDLVPKFRVVDTIWTTEAIR